MPATPVRGRGAALAMTLAVIGGVIALTREIAAYADGGAVDWGHVALGFGVPALFYAIFWGTPARRSR